MPNTTNIYEEIPDMDTMGGRLSRAREASGISVKQLAWRLGVKISTIQAWESDRSQPGAHRMNMMAGMLNVSLSWILYGVGIAPAEHEFDESDDETLDAVGAQIIRLRRLHAETGNLIDRLEDGMARRAS